MGGTILGFPLESLKSVSPKPVPCRPRALWLCPRFVPTIFPSPAKSQALMLPVFLFLDKKPSHQLPVSGGTQQEPARGLFIYTATVNWTRTVGQGKQAGETQILPPRSILIR